MKEYRPYTRRKKLSPKERRRREDSQRQGSFVSKQTAREQFDALFPVTVRITCPHGCFVEEMDYWTTSSITNLPDNFAWDCAHCNPVCPHNNKLTPDEINSGKQYSKSCSECRANRPATWADMIEKFKEPLAGGRYPTTLERDADGVFKKKSGKFFTTGGLLAGVPEKGTKMAAKKKSTAGRDGDAGYDESTAASQCSDAGMSTSGHHGTFATIKIGDIAPSAAESFQAEQGISDLPPTQSAKPLQHGERVDGVWKRDKQIILTSDEKKAAKEIVTEANNTAADADAIERAEIQDESEKADIMQQENLSDEEYELLETT